MDASRNKQIKFFHHIRNIRAFKLESSSSLNHKRNKRKTKDTKKVLVNGWGASKRKIEISIAIEIKIKIKEESEINSDWQIVNVFGYWQ